MRTRCHGGEIQTFSCTFCISSSSLFQLPKKESENLLSHQRSSNMTTTNISTILDELGWQSGFRIPVANEENKRLEEEIARKMKLKESLLAKLESTEDRYKMMKKRTSNLTIEQEINQKLLTEHSAQLETEDHHYRLCCNTESSLRQEARNFEKEWQDINEVVSNIEKNLKKVTKQIEESKKAVKFDKSNIEKWEEILNKNEEDNKLIEKYLKEDAKEYKELELKRQKLSAELEFYRTAIIRTSNETREMEIVLDRTAKLYNEGLKEYRQLFNHWKESVIVLQQRNDEIKKLMREIELLRELSENKKGALHESETFLNDQIENNKTLEETIKQSEKKLFLMKQEHLKIKETFDTYQTELRIQKNLVKELAQRTQQVRTDIKCKENEIENKYAKMEDVKQQIDNLTTKVEDIDSQKLNVEEKTRELEKIIEEQEKRKAEMIKEMNRLQMANLRVTNQSKDIESECKTIRMQYQNEIKKSEYLDTLYAKDEANLEQQKEELYQVEFELQKSEMKLERLRGHERDKSEADRKDKKIEELQTIVDEKTEVSKILQKQITSLKHDMRRISNSLANDNNELERLKNKRQDLVLLMDGGEKRLKAAQAQNEEKQVEESMLLLKVSQMKKMISILGDNVYDLEKYRLELEAAVRERKAEIAVQRESIVIQKRIAANEYSELRCAVAERKGRIRQLQTRYALRVATFGTNPDETPIDTTYFKIQSAQERFLLQDQGDKLDETIRRTELEIQSMENTLRVINVCNDKYKATLSVNEQNLPEKEERKKLDDELYNTEEKLKQKQEELQNLTESFKKIEEDYAQVRKDIENANEQNDEKKRYLTDLDRQINEQKEKLLRADKNLRAAHKDIQHMYSCTGDRTVLLQEKEVELHQIQERNAVVLQDISELTIRHVEAEAYIKKLLAAKNIELPSISLFSQSPHQIHSATSSIQHPLKSTSRSSVNTSSKESIGKVVNLEAQFEKPCSNVPRTKDAKSIQRSTKVQSKQSIKKTS